MAASRSTFQYEQYDNAAGTAVLTARYYIRPHTNDEFESDKQYNCSRDTLWTQHNSSLSHAV